MLVITESFLKKELKPLRKYYTVQNIKKSVCKINTSAIYLARLGYRHGKFLKIRMAHKIAGRLIIYVFTNKNIITPIIMRLKKDKIFGENLSLNNKKGKNLILKMLDFSINDIKNGRYKKI
ncbi:hypothetical protein CL633_00735 [bacterium]|nr:hypothetical protein [bacterium]|tara:strand:- start:584 stop:946 length:363 start_codon:yes stop_codon:yes gene_type:complete